MERTIEAIVTVPVAPGRARAVLLDDPGTVLAERRSDEQRRTRTFLTELAVGVGGGTALRQEVRMHAGLPNAVGEGVVMPLEWRATGHEALLPAFHGDLELSPRPTGTQLRLIGEYQVPLGVVGRFADGLAGRRVGRRSISAFLEGVARRLDDQVRRAASQPQRLVRYDVVVRETTPSEGSTRC